MLLFTIVLILTVLYFLLKKKQKKNDLDLFPEPEGYFFFGHAIHIASTTKIIPVTSEYLNRPDKTVRTRLGPRFLPIRTVLATSDYKFIEFLLSTNKILTKSESYQFLRNWLGDGLLLSDGNYWKRHRKILTPAFHFDILKEFVETFENVGNLFVQKLRNYVEKSNVDLEPLVVLCTLDVICETAMGTKLNVQQGQNPEYVKSVKDMCRIAINRCLAPLKYFKETYWMTPDFYREKKALKVLHSFTTRVIDSKKENRFASKTKKMAFLDLLLKFSREEDALSYKEIQEEVDTFMFEGHDTTSSGICFTLYCLADNPNVQEKILQEQKTLFGDEKNPRVTYTELQSMKYLERVIKESLRLYPPVPLIGRYTTEDTEFDNRVIPKGTNIVIFIFGMLRNPEFFPDPEKFNPDRFEDSNRTLPYAYIPFSAGPRNCIGQKFAMLELKSIISKIVRNFEIRPTVPRHEVKLSAEAVLKSTTGVKVRLLNRT